MVEYNIPILMTTVLIPIVLSPIAYIAGKYMKEKAGWITFLILLYPLAVGTMAILKGEGVVEPAYIEAPVIGPFRMTLDGLSAPFYFTIALLSALIAIYSIPYMKHRIEEADEELPSYGAYYALYLIYAAGMLGAVLATNLLEFYIYFELMLIPSFLHIAMWGYGNRGRIALMYFLWTHAGAILLLIGILSIKVYTGTFVMSELITLNLDTVVTIPVKWIVLALTIGLFVKMAVFGLHIWLPYAHAEAPTPISALLSPAMIGIGGYAVARIVVELFPKTFFDVSTYLIILAIVTMAYGGLMALTQDDFKRFLAYSSISQMGYILLGLAAFHVYGLTGSIIQYVSHGFGKAVLFMTAGVIIMEGHGLRSIAKMGGLAKRMPLTAVAAFMGFLTIAGVPPWLGFQAEWPLFLGVFGRAFSLVSTYDFLLGVLALFTTTFTVAYAVWTIRRIFFGSLPGHLEEMHDPPWTAIGPMLILAVLSVLFGVYPEPFIKLAYGFASSLLGLGG